MAHANQAHALLFKKAVGLHQQGRLDQAVSLYRDIVRRNPAHLDAWHNLAQLCLQADQPDASLAAIEHALSLNPSAPDLLRVKAEALYALNRPAEAATLLQQLAAAPECGALVFAELAQAQEAMGKKDAAIASYRRALQVDPDFLPALVNLSLLLESRGETQAIQATGSEIIDRVTTLLEQDPTNVEHYLTRGNALRWAKRYEDAIRDYNRVLELSKRNIHALINRGHAYHDWNQHQGAVESYALALQIERNEATLWSYCGDSLSELGRHTEALEHHKAAVRLAPDNADIRCHYGVALEKANHFEEALVQLDLALQQNSTHGIAMANRSAVLYRMNRVEEALASARASLRFQSGYAPAHSHMGVALLALNMIPAAILQFRTALKLDPKLTLARHNLAMALLVSGDYSGLQYLESRWDMSSHGSTRRFPNLPPWLGAEDVAGKTILLHSEQGYGDTLNYCRYAPLLAHRGAKVILQVQEPLVALLSCLPGVQQVIGVSDQTPPFDLHCPLMSLPLAMGTTAETIPNASCYLAADPQSVQKWAQRLGQKTRGRIGLAWSGNSAHVNDLNRSMTLQMLVDALPPGFDYICLQKDIRDNDRQTLKSNALGLREFGDELADFSDTAALCTLMDLVICVDTSVAHLAGALGTKTWLMLPFSPDQRWMLDRSDSPWYPSMTLIRQPKRHDWSSVLQKVGAALAG